MTSQQSLTDVLAQLIDLLDPATDVYWLQQLITARNAMLRGEAEGIRRLLSLDGDGASLTALRMSSDAAQARFDALVASAFAAARRCQSEETG
ncbi:MAG: hypothetical protein AAF290_02855 [Pseudomonadota bacterium]